MIELKLKESEVRYKLKKYEEVYGDSSRWRIFPENCTESTTVPKSFYDIIEVDE